MKKFVPHLVLTVFALAPAGAAWADDLDVTMQVVPANASASQATSEIRLPDTASERAKEASAFGQSVANQARDPNREFGREFGQSVSEAAHQKNPVPNLPPQSRRP